MSCLLLKTSFIFYKMSKLLTLIESALVCKKGDLRTPFIWVRRTSTVTTLTLQVISSKLALISSRVLWAVTFQNFRQFGQSSCYRKYNCSPFQTQLSSFKSFNRKLRAISVFRNCHAGKVHAFMNPTVQPDFIGQVAFRSLFLYWNVNFEALILHSKPKF